jgi:hypothetical protein
VLLQKVAVFCPLLREESLDLHIFVLLEDSVCIKHGSVIHFFHIGAGFGSLERKKQPVTQHLSNHISFPLSVHPFPALKAVLLTMATQPRAWMLSLTADR